MAHSTHFGGCGSSSSSSDSEGGGVLLADHPTPPLKPVEIITDVTAWLSSIDPASSPAKPPPLLALAQVTTVQSLDIKHEERPQPPAIKSQARHISPARSPPPAQRPRSSPYAIAFPKPIPANIPSTTKSTAPITPTRQISAAISLLPFHLDTIAFISTTPYAGICPFIFPVNCPHGPSCTLKMLCPPAKTLCPMYLRAEKQECENLRVEHRNGRWLHRGDDGFKEIVMLWGLRGVHERGEWGVIGGGGSVEGWMGEETMDAWLEEWLGGKLG